MPASDLDYLSLKSQLRDHRLYHQLTSPARLRMFMEHHVVCVWDFMSLLKSLQADLTCLSVPWVPTIDAASARFINEIVLGEETDALPSGEPISHFEWYRRAMQQVGANTQPIDQLLEQLHAGQDFETALTASSLPDAATDFARRTWHVLEQPLAVRAAVFFHAREDLIPRMFVGLVERLEHQGLECGLLIAYLQRHIETDGEEHGPMAQQLLDRLFVQHPQQRDQAHLAVIAALNHRIELWNRIETLLPNAHHHVAPSRNGTAVEIST